MHGDMGKFTKCLLSIALYGGAVLWLTWPLGSQLSSHLSLPATPARFFMAMSSIPVPLLFCTVRRGFAWHSMNRLGPSLK